MRIVFEGDVVLDTFNNVSRDEDNILDQKYIKQMSGFLILCENAY